MIAQLYPAFRHWDNQTTWLYSDAHFGASELETGLKNKPNDEEHIKMINSKVGRKDTLLFLGDVGDIETAKKLRGYKVLIKGNHDSGSTNYQDAFNEIYSGPVIISEKIILSHEPLDIPGFFNIHGHVHNGYINTPNHFNVCSGVNNYEPINFNQWLKQGYLSKIVTLHRATIDNATKRSKKRKEKKSCS